ncbi:MAG: hypothetical protein IJ087_01490 [Eggerthellaceae bacterium]|nr:hypothetical protein [Eggerthellaceae bacterium]
MTDAWKHPWADTVWHSPSGREIHHEAGDELHEVELALPDGTSRYHHYAGPAPESVIVDGKEWTREAP